MNNIKLITILNEIEKNKHLYPETDLYTRIVKQNQEYYTKDLVDVFKRML